MGAFIIPLAGAGICGDLGLTGGAMIYSVDQKDDKH